MSGGTLCVNQMVWYSRGPNGAMYGFLEALKWRKGWVSRGPNGSMDGILEALMAQWMGFSRP